MRRPWLRSSRPQRQAPNEVSQGVDRERRDQPSPLRVGDPVEEGLQVGPVQHPGQQPNADRDAQNSEENGLQRYLGG